MRMGCMCTGVHVLSKTRRGRWTPGASIAGNCEPPKWILRTEHGSWHRKPDPGNWGRGEVLSFHLNPGFTYASVLLLSYIPQTYLLIGNALNGTESTRRQMLVRTWAACLTPLLEPPVPLFKAKLCYTSMNILPKTARAFIIYTKNSQICISMPQCFNINNDVTNTHAYLLMGANWYSFIQKSLYKANNLLV